MIIVDAYNFLYAMYGLEGDMPIGDMAKARERLAENLVRYHNITGEEFIAVYDARGRVRLPNEHYPGLHVVYAPPHSNADDYIVRSIRNAPNPARVIVVTTDQELTVRVQELGGRTMRSGEFCAEMKRAFEHGAKPPDEKTREKPERPTPEEIEYFLRQFGKQD